MNKEEKQLSEDFLGFSKKQFSKGIRQQRDQKQRRKRPLGANFSLRRSPSSLLQVLSREVKGQIISLLLLVICCISFNKIIGRRGSPRPLFRQARIILKKFCCLTN